jgi:hypothetical protein
MIEAVLFDLDDVLIHEGFADLILSSENPQQYLCEETLSVLQYVKNLGLKMALVSHNPQGYRALARPMTPARFHMVINMVAAIN